MRTLMREERCALLLASFSARFCLELLPPSSIPPWRWASSRRAVHAAVGALLRILVHLADERVGIGPELQGILAGAVGVLFLAGDASFAILRSLSI